ncbi:RNA polymerase sigma factor [Allostreptomyces psammosilenae]|uniref:RNA polymerase sigma-70 factor (ECF subfamily) n=1 Tax=Allostreptomyces psammosilenae TaxID=1892865 RepID=A0A853A0E2_9ACTN|nr:RNA polymerase sigma factor [Allostreptomyces psammosilenae]NYI06930.1 RNA polymerase sigma-70 factor (ECF subfamily) [Allostreptomyces psammosilenae]
MELSLRARLISGDPGAFTELFDAHARAVYAHAVRVTGDWSTAEDVVSLTFLEAWRLRGKLRPEGDSPRPWLLGIATNVLRNTTRAARRHQGALARLPAREIVPDFADELVGRMVDAEQLAAAQRALRRLRRAEREVFTLCVWAGLDYASAAEALGVPVGTVRSRLSRARSKLRRLTEAELGRGGEKPEPLPGSGQVQGGRTTAARSNQEKTR